MDLMTQHWGNPNVLAQPQPQQALPAPEPLPAPVPAPAAEAEGNGGEVMVERTVLEAEREQILTLVSIIHVARL